MSTLYHTGLVIGLIVVYLLATFGISVVLSMMFNSSNRTDDELTLFVVTAAYIVGLFIFLFLSTQLLEAKGYWDLPQSQIIEEIETEVME